MRMVQDEVKNRRMIRKKPRPPYIVSIRSMSNDTEIPSFHFNSQTRELYCDWKGMYTAFLTESKLYSTMLSKWVRTYHYMIGQ